jgi:hypothetical protein
MLKHPKAAMIWSLALGGALVVGCSREEDKSTGTGAGGSPATQPTTRPGMEETDRPTPGRGPTTRPGADATGLIPAAPDVAGTPGSPPLPGIPAIPGADEAEAAAGRVLPSTRPTTMPSRITLPGVRGDADADNK